MASLTFGIGLTKRVLDKLRQGNRFTYRTSQTVYVKGEVVLIEIEVGLFRRKGKRSR